MKKKICVFLIVTMSILTGCSNEPPEGTSQEMYNIGLEALEILDDYIDGKMSVDTCDRKIDDLYEESEKILEQTGSDYPNDEIIHEDLLMISISNTSAIYVGEHETYSHEDHRAMLKTDLGM